MKLTKDVIARSKAVRKLVLEAIDKNWFKQWYFAKMVWMTDSNFSTFIHKHTELLEYRVVILEKYFWIKK